MAFHEADKVDCSKWTQVGFLIELDCGTQNNVFLLQ